MDAAADSLVALRDELNAIRAVIDEALDNGAEHSTLGAHAALLRHKKERLAALEDIERAAETNRQLFRLG